MNWDSTSTAEEYSNGHIRYPAHLWGNDKEPSETETETEYGESMKNASY